MNTNNYSIDYYKDVVEKFNKNLKISVDKKYLDQNECTEMLKLGKQILSFNFYKQIDLSTQNFDKLKNDCTYCVQQYKANLNLIDRILHPWSPTSKLHETVLSYEYEKTTVDNFLKLDLDILNIVRQYLPLSDWYSLCSASREGIRILTWWNIKAIKRYIHLEINEEDLIATNYFLKIKTKEFNNFLRIQNESLKSIYLTVSCIENVPVKSLSEVTIKESIQKCEQKKASDLIKLFDQTIPGKHTGSALSNYLTLCVKEGKIEKDISDFEVQKDWILSAPIGFLKLYLALGARLKAKIVDEKCTIFFKNKLPPATFFDMSQEQDSIERTKCFIQLGIKSSTLLALSISDNRLIMFKTCLEQTVPNTFYKGFLPLHYAVIYKNLSALNLLLEKGTMVPIDYKDRNGRTALWHAINAGEHHHHFIDIISSLLNHKADVNFKDSNKDSKGKSLLHFLLKKSEYAIYTFTQLKCLQMLIEHGADVNVRDASGKTPLSLALKSNKPEDIILTLLQAKQKIEISHHDLFYAIMRGGSDKGPQIIELMLETIQDQINQPFVKRDLGSGPYCPLSLVATLLIKQLHKQGYEQGVYYKQNFLNSMEIILKAGADININMPDGRLLRDYLLQESYSWKRVISQRGERSVADVLSGVKADYYDIGTWHQYSVLSVIQKLFKKYGHSL